MAKFQQILVLFSIFFCFGYCKKCLVGDREIEVAENVNCAVFTPVKEYKNQADQIVKPYFWEGFPFQPGSGFPPQFPGVGWPAHWFGGRRRRPTRRPPVGDNEECPDEGFKLISHPTNCEKYVLCSDGVEVATLECPNNFHFSRILRACVHPFDAECEAFKFECDPENPALQFIPDTTDCKSYYMCVGANQISLQCPPGLHWSFIENQCLPPEQANCPFDEEGEELLKNPARSANSMILPPNFIPPINIENPGLAPTSQCPPAGVEQIPKPGNCEGFIICFNGMEFPQQCPTGLYFCQDRRSCVPPEEANCGGGCPSTGFSFLPHEDDCNLYYICFNGIQHLMACPGDTHWSVKTEQCMDPLEAGCKNLQSPAECPATGIEQIPYPDNCEKYILCVNGFEIPLQCGGNLHFSPTLRVCTVPELAECEEYEKSCPDEDDPLNLVFLPSQEDCNMYYFCWGGNQIPMRCPNNFHWNARKNECMHPDEANCEIEAFECPAEGVENFPNPDSCTKFFLCVNGQEFDRECPGDLHFSPHTRTCMHPDLAGCKGWECPETGIGFIPDPEDCSSYFFCFNGQEVQMRCAPNTHWSILDQACLPIQIANCPFDEEGEEPVVKETCPETGIKAIPHPTSCHQYILCINGADMVRDCPPFTEFSPETRTCVHPIVAQCFTNLPQISSAMTETCPSIKSIQDIVFRANLEDCESYYLCLPNEETVPMRCGKGFHWSASKQKCMSQDQAHCKA